MKKTLLSVATVTALTGIASHNISAAEYTVESGDTLWGLANENGTSASSLKEVNGLSSNVIFPGDVIEMDGENSEVPAQEKKEDDGTYVIEPGDTLFEIGQKFDVDYQRIKEWNNLSSNMIFAGKTIIVSADAAPAASSVEEAPQVEETPAVEETPQTEAQTEDQNTAQAAEVEEAPQVEEDNSVDEQVAAEQQAVQQQAGAEAAEQQVQEQNTARAAGVDEAPAVEEEPQAPSPANQSVSYGSNHYTQGDCTWYVFDRRQQMGKAVSGSWGNASNWAGAASSEGMSVNNSPSVGAIMQSAPGQNDAGGQGHVAVVESVNGDGSIQVSEMNWNGGMGVQSTRTLSASEAANHTFIH